MATSASTNWSVTRDNIITTAYQILGQYSSEETISGADVDLANTLLNGMIKTFQAQGYHLWTMEEATLFPEADKVKYSLGSGGDHAAKTSDVVKTTLSGAEASGQTVLSVTSATGMAVNDNIGIELDNDTIQWTTISSISSNDVTVATALTSAAASGNFVYTYTTKLERPLDISQMRRVNADDTETVLYRLGREKYFSLSDKTTESSVTSWFYDPQLTTGKLYLYPEPSNMQERFQFTYLRSIEDFDAGTNDPDFPQEWFEALIWNLAARLAPAFGKEEKASLLIIPYASQTLQLLKGWDTDKADLQIQPQSRIGFGRGPG